MVVEIKNYIVKCSNCGRMKTIKYCTSKRSAKKIIKDEGWKIKENYNLCSECTIKAPPLIDIAGIKWGGDYKKHIEQKENN